MNAWEKELLKVRLMCKNQECLVKMWETKLDRLHKRERRYFRRLQKLQATLDETQNRISEIDSEIVTLRSNKHKGMTYAVHNSSVILEEETH